eukprot:13860559-Ditylum_brightwellii.AAC.1
MRIKRSRFTVGWKGLVLATVMEARTMRRNASHADTDKTVTVEKGGEDDVWEQHVEVGPSEPTEKNILANHKLS